MNLRNLSTPVKHERVPRLTTPGSDKSIRLSTSPSHQKTISLSLMDRERLIWNTLLLLSVSVAYLLELELYL